MDRMLHCNHIGSTASFASTGSGGAIIGGVYAAAMIALAVLVFGPELGDLLPVFRRF